jgi:hypothetical protein
MDESAELKRLRRENVELRRASSAADVAAESLAAAASREASPVRAGPPYSLRPTGTVRVTACGYAVVARR